MTEMRAIRWSFDDAYAVDGSFNDDLIYDGFTDGTTWNGWDNVWVTPEVHKKVMAAIVADGGTVEDFAECTTNDDGLVCYGWMFCTSIFDEESSPGEHVPDYAWSTTHAVR